jgi:hypothetical protein
VSCRRYWQVPGHVCHAVSRRDTAARSTQETVFNVDSARGVSSRVGTECATTECDTSAASCQGPVRDTDVSGALGGGASRALSKAAWAVEVMSPRPRQAGSPSGDDPRARPTAWRLGLGSGAARAPDTPESPGTTRRY